MAYSLISVIYLHFIYIQYVFDEERKIIIFESHDY